MQTDGHYQRRIPQNRQKPLAVPFAFFVALTLLFSVPVPTLAVTSAEKQAEADEVMRQLDVLQTELAQASQDLEKATAAQNTALTQMQDAQTQEKAAIAQITSLQKKLGDRAKETYCNGNPSYLEVFFGARSFAEVITSLDMLNRLNAHDAQLTQEARVARKEAENARQTYTEQERIAAEKKNEIASLKAEMEQKSIDMAAEIDRLTEEAAELLAQEEAAAEAARLAAAAAAIGTGSVSAEQIAALPKFTHPCPGGGISSGFGWRSFDNSFHKGLDLAASEGTPIYAAVGGTVIISGYSPSAGNWVVISHGSGLVTKYMHASALYVSAGQTVSAGEAIATVGNTGNSFGAHLHFQVEINGTAVDPLPFL
jgi:murein DD-endopeptidase MepM/ murein hydrolase activator NlpD